VVDPDKEIFGTAKTNGETYSNAKAQAHGYTAALFYNTFRFIVLGQDVDPADMISIDIEDDEKFNKLAKELSTPIWVKSGTNSRKSVESKQAMEKRTGQPSPNMADVVHMLTAPFEPEKRGFLDVAMAKAQARQEGQKFSTHTSRTQRKRTSSGGKGLAGFYG